MSTTKEIINQLLTEGKYSKEYEIMEGFKIRFKTRNVQEINKIKDKLAEKAENIKLQMDYSYYLMLYTLPFAIEEINGTPFQADFDTKLNRLLQMPAPIIAKIMENLDAFDREVMAAMGVDDVKKQFTETESYKQE